MTVFHGVSARRSEKLGLALSGGGFRASFFHIGVLATLADLDLLRHVQLLSTVSGGSIVGTFYYVKLKQLLESRPDQHISSDDYKKLVADLSSEFLSAVQQNPRLLTLINPVKNLRTRRADYSRTDRMGEVFDALFYRPLFGPTRRDPVCMHELKIIPHGERADFHPEKHNRFRSAKVPILLINATTLNTGRNWRFEAIRMGEPPPVGRHEQDVDRKTQLLRPARYDELSPDRRRITLGHAVAASAAVPGYFPPLSVSGMYENIRVQLVDGGVHDNQGVQGLLDRGCTQLIVSDGSYQMLGVKDPSTALPHVLLRTYSVLTDRIREEQILSAGYRRNVSTLAFVHMRKGLAPKVVPYIGKDGAPVSLHESDETGEKRGDSARRDVIDARVQERLARIRTDLDAFHDTEAFSLMRCGYVLSKQIVASKQDEMQKEMDSGWQFNQVKDLMARPTKRYMALLKAGESTFLKLFLLKPGLGVVILSLTALCLGLILWRLGPYFTSFISQLPLVPSPTVGWGLLAVVVLLSYEPCRHFLLNIPGVQQMVYVLKHPATWIWRFFIRGIPSALASGFIYMYLKTLNPLYVRAGQLNGRPKRDESPELLPCVGRSAQKVPRNPRFDG